MSRSAVALRVCGLLAASSAVVSCATDEAIDCSGVIAFELQGSTPYGTGQLDVCVDGQCWRGQPSAPSSLGVSLAIPGEQPAAPRPRVVSFSVGRNRPTSIRWTIRESDFGTVGTGTPPTVPDRSGCYSATYQVDLSMGSRPTG